MNNYKNMLEYYNYDNNNYNQPMYTKNMNSNALYDSYNGFIRGNMYPTLYNTYKNDKPFEIKPMNEQAKLLTMVDAYCFALIDIGLYLDIYGNDTDMLTLYKDYRNELKRVKKEYENKYGPLLLTSDAIDKYPWSWDNNPWPWEN